MSIFSTPASPAASASTRASAAAARRLADAAASAAAARRRRCRRWLRNNSDVDGVGADGVCVDVDVSLLRVLRAEERWSGGGGTLWY